MPRKSFALGFGSYKFKYDIMFLTAPNSHTRIFFERVFFVGLLNTTTSTTVPKRSTGVYIVAPTPTRANIGHLTPILGQLCKHKKPKDGPKVPYSSPWQ